MLIINPSEKKGERGGGTSEMHCIQMTCFYYIFILPRKQLICDFKSIKNAADFKVAVVASRFFGIDIIVHELTLPSSICLAEHWKTIQWDKNQRKYPVQCIGLSSDILSTNDCDCLNVQIVQVLCQQKVNLLISFRLTTSHWKRIFYH